MTPLTNPATNSEEAYNAAHTKTRSIIERTFGLLKSRFRCLDKSGGTLLYTPEKTCKLFVAAAVLHNYSRLRKLPAAVDDGVVARDGQLQPQTAPPPPCAAAAGHTAVQLRRQLVNHF